MKLKHLAAALSLGFAAASASAASVESLSGPLYIKLGGLTTEAYTQQGTNETTWGVGFIDSITATKNGDKWSSGDGYYLYYMIYGIADDEIRPNNSKGNDIFNVGATGGVADGKIHLDVYKSATRILEIDGLLNAKPADRIDYDSYAAFSGLGDAYLKFEFHPGVIQDDPLTAYDESRASLYQDTVGTSLPTSGSGVFLMDVVGGSAPDWQKWNNNGQPLGSDAAGNFTLRPNYNIPPGPGNPIGSQNNPNCSQADVMNNRCFAGQINDPIHTGKLPEPGSLALLGLGFAGLAGLRRRRAAK